MFISQQSYNSQLVNGTFLGKLVGTSSYNDFLNNYHLPFWRYIYYSCQLGSSGPYPNPAIISDQDIINWVMNGIYNLNVFAPFNKILIGEAPNNPNTYFYKSTGSYNSIGWSGDIKNALLPNQVFNTREDFLVACSKSGFLLIDIFPYDIKYNKVNGRNKAFRSHWNLLLHRLTGLSKFISPTFALAFGLIRIGKIVIEDKQINQNHSLQNWINNNHKSLISINSSNSLDSLRPNQTKGESRYIRVCGRTNQYGPSTNHLNLAGII
ncbi:hypothetical protein G9H61_10765 [Aquirufa ecclesiirivi]|uniref:Uncharacterized protein n=1 Tax=Aquirufa ecclesiirivi TaxID=2715124 RepID=A0ABT4JIJ5_9BACT|nr:hypothetical protein [Aquirufa ecclesiirivi]MCZ2475932.1 hypothetical protein [Aquirufa ecclesiirivi]